MSFSFDSGTQHLVKKITYEDRFASYWAVRSVSKHNIVYFQSSQAWQMVFSVVMDGFVPYSFTVRGKYGIQLNLNSAKMFHSYM